MPNPSGFRASASTSDLLGRCRTSALRVPNTLKCSNSQQLLRAALLPSQPDQRPGVELLLRKTAVQEHTPIHVLRDRHQAMLRTSQPRAEVTQAPIGMEKRARQRAEARQAAALRHAESQRHFEESLLENNLRKDSVHSAASSHRRNSRTEVRSLAYRPRSTAWHPVEAAALNKTPWLAAAGTRERAWLQTVQLVALSHQWHESFKYHQFMMADGPPPIHTHPSARAAARSAGMHSARPARRLRRRAPQSRGLTPRRTARTSARARCGGRSTPTTPTPVGVQGRTAWA